MSNQTFLTLVALIILLLAGVLLQEKYEACQAAAKSFSDCFRTNRGDHWR